MFVSFCLLAIVAIAVRIYLKKHKVDDDFLEIGMTFFIASPILAVWITLSGEGVLALQHGWIPYEFKGGPALATLVVTWLAGLIFIAIHFKKEKIRKSG